MQVGINGFFWGREETGSGQYLQGLVGGLASLEADLRCALVAPHNGPLPGDVERYPVRLPRLGRDLSKLWFEQLTFSAACQRLEADVAHVPYFAAPLFSSVPTVVTVHDLIPLILGEYRGSLLVRGYTQLVSAAARRAQALISDSESARQDILARLGVPEERVHVVPLAVDDRLDPAPEEAQQQLRRRYHLPETFLLYLGGFDRRKNLITLFRALARLRDRLRPPPVLAIAGRLHRRETRVVADPRRQASEAGVSDLVRYLGWISPAEKPALYSAASLFAFPSSYEGFGLPPLEAMACGTPVVASDSSSLPEVVGSGGLLVPPDDSEAWSEALASLLEDNSKRQMLGDAALAHSRRFSWHRTAEATAAVYESTREVSL